MILTICLISVRSKQQRTLSPCLLELVSIYMKVSPIEGVLVAAVFPVGLFFLLVL